LRPFRTMASMNAIRIVGLACAMSLGLIVGLLLGGGALMLAVLLVGVGGALMLGICAWTERQ
jgi:hypothetical protein